MVPLHIRWGSRICNREGAHNLENNPSPAGGYSSRALHAHRTYWCSRESGGVDPPNHPYFIPICTPIMVPIFTPPNPKP